MIDLYTDIKQCKEEIHRVSVSSNHPSSIRWHSFASDLGTKVKVDMLPWWWPKKSMYAITISSSLIWVTDKHLSDPLTIRAARYVHEMVHVVQYLKGELNWFKYATSSGYRDVIESFAKYEQNLFLSESKKHRL